MKSKQSELNGERRPATRHFLLWCFLPLLMGVVWAGCKQEAKVAADTSPAGTYALVSVDGNKVPCTVQHDGHGIAVKGGTFVINADGTCSSKMEFSVPSGAAAGRLPTCARRRAIT